MQFGENSCKILQILPDTDKHACPEGIEARKHLCHDTPPTPPRPLPVPTTHPSVLDPVSPRAHGLIASVARGDTNVFASLH